jgi:hypothetical protein
MDLLIRNMLSMPLKDNKNVVLADDITLLPLLFYCYGKSYCLQIMPFLTKTRSEVQVYVKFKREKEV